MQNLLIVPYILIPAITFFAIWWLQERTLIVNWSLALVCVAVSGLAMQAALAASLSLFEQTLLTGLKVQAALVLASIANWWLYQPRIPKRM